MKYVTPLLLTIFFSIQLPAQLLSPEAFLGYKLGAKYTPHWQVVNYINHVAQQAPELVKLQQYGLTNEGRPLMAVFISSGENNSNLENIRRNNLRLAGMAKDKMMPSEDAPAIVWLSYNVHGNEPSPTEAAMLTLYELANPDNTKTKRWLQHTVVIIDPCLNPDGRERYVSWFTSVSSKDHDPSLDAREHHEPWPGGRTNHYYFDLNRDWAWQTQVESQQRMKLYKSWLPQVHVDYHEQEVNQPYYFAPAAQPYHDVITPWQQEFQVAVGKKHAEYFDANSWLYFTREIFDLYYPSYGDTYPLFNGAVGMTYEQAGGPQGGINALTDEGDTLTLYDRIMHHYTTSLGTIETASQHSAKLVKEFHTYFNDALTKGSGEYKSFVIKNDPARAEQLKALLELLDKNGIRYSKGQGAGRGFNYDSGKEEAFTVNAGDIIISAFQPHATLVRVLFEPRPRLADSVTYDITAWALPYVYGLSGYASREKIAAAGGEVKAAPVSDTIADAYGYIIKWSGIHSAKVLAQLIKQHIKVRFTEEPFELNGEQFDRGSLLIIKTSNQASGAGNSLWNKVASICNEAGIMMYPVKTGFVDKGYDFGSAKVHPVKTPQVALLTGDDINSNAVGEVWLLFEQELDYPVTLINVNDLGSADWKEISVLVMPDGNYRFLSDKQAVEPLKVWINNGGKVVAIGSAVKQLAALDSGIKIKKPQEEKKDDDEKKDPYELLKKYNARERDAITNTTPGSIYKVDLDNTHPLGYGYPGYYYTLKMDGNIYEYFKDGGWNVGIVKKENQVAGFVGSKLKDKLKDGLLFGELPMGKGSIVLLADDPLFRSFWENGKLLFCNAVFMDK
jgi:hypothetical protein